MSTKLKILISIILIFIISKTSFGQMENVESTLEVYHIESNKREVILKEKNHFEAPNWSLDGTYFIINSKGLLYKVSRDGKLKAQIPTDFAQKCNNDHGISPDGTQLVISHHDERNVPEEDWGFRTSRIFILPIEGGTPKEVTSKTPSFWHGWSPDGQRLAYVGLRNGEFDIYAISVEGGEETRLTDAEGLDDGPDYSPDGKYIYYNSMQSGKMEIWRMDNDGANKTQITNDAYSNWFPHPSPDGKYLVYIAYLEDQGDRHPPMKQVALRLYDIESKAIRTLCEFTGGQGTINVPSWAPDSKSFAFVRYEFYK